jgi:hypothetical protein
MAFNKQVFWRIGLGGTLLVSSLLFAAALMLDVYAGRSVPFMDYLTVAVGVCVGTHWIITGRKLRKNDPLFTPEVMEKLRQREKEMAEGKSETLSPEDLNRS